MMARGTVHDITTGREIGKTPDIQGTFLAYLQRFDKDAVTVASGRATMKQYRLFLTKIEELGYTVIRVPDLDSDVAVIFDNE